MAISFDKAFGLHQQALLVRDRRAQVLSENIANADTPGYKAKDLDFQQALTNAQSRQSQPINRTHNGHFAISTAVRQEEKFRNPDQPDTGDGNSVDMHRERNVMMQNAIEYQTSLQFLNSRISGLKKAITGTGQ
ncbi:flagellar basal body rod protein FlgB [Alishewanella longhuensis]